MTIKSTIPALVAALALGGAGGALAQTSAQENTAATVGAGAAEASPYGASAGGVTAGKAMNRGYERRSGKHEDKQDRRRGRVTSPAEAANSASTYGAGALSTTRDSANVGVTTGGSAAGSGSQSAGSTVDAYGETTRDGSNADLYGDSTAQSGDQRR